MNEVEGKINGSLRDEYPEVYSIADIRGHRGEYRSYYVRQRDNDEDDDEYPSEEVLPAAFLTYFYSFS